MSIKVLTDNRSKDLSKIYIEDLFSLQNARNLNVRLFFSMFEWCISSISWMYVMHVCNNYLYFSSFHIPHIRNSYSIGLSSYQKFFVLKEPFV